MAKKLTAASVGTYKSDEVRREIPDGKCSGLYLVIQPTGQKSWALRFRSPIDLDAKGHRKARKLTLGAVATGDVDGAPEIGKPLSLAGARSLASAALDQVERGIDPTYEHRATRLSAKAKAIAAAEDDIEEVFKKFMKRHAEVHTRESSWRETERIFNKRVQPKWRGRSVQHILKRDVIDLLDGIVDDGAPIMANRTLSAIRRFFNWCVERDILATSPCTGVKPPGMEQSRDRFLGDDELRALWAAADTVGNPYAAIVKMLILTGQRVDEVRELPASGELDLDDKLWTLPAKRSKNGEAHNVPLSTAALGVLKKSAPKIKKAAYYFTTTGPTPFSALSAAKDLVDAEMLKKLREGDPKAKLAPWQLRDLRRTVETGLQRLGFSVEIADAVTNHKSRTRAGVSGVYARYDYAKEKAAALDAWAKYVEHLVSPPGAQRLMQ